jgi:hypothetical protein
MKIGMTVVFNDGNKKNIDAVFADFVAFERTWNRSVTKFEQELRLTDLAWLAWHSEKRRKETGMGFDPDWIGTVSEIELQEDVEDEVPLEKTQRTS